MVVTNLDSEYPLVKNSEALVNPGDRPYSTRPNLSPSKSLKPKSSKHFNPTHDLVY